MKRWNKLAWVRLEFGHWIQMAPNRYKGKEKEKSMQIFKMAAVGSAMVAVIGMASNEAAAAQKTRVQLTCEQIRKNRQNETLGRVVKNGF